MKTPALGGMIATDHFGATRPQSRTRAVGWRDILAVSIGVLLGLEAGGGAASVTWNGGSAVDSNFTSVANWNAAPASNDDFVFRGTLRLNPHNDFATLTMNTLTFAPGAGAFTLTGNAISLTAGMANNTGNLQTISFGGMGLRLLGAQTWTANTAALEIDAGLNATSAVNLNGFTLTIAGVQNTTIRGVVFGTGSLIKDGPGTLELTGTEANSYLGTTTVNDGTLSLNGAGAFSKIIGDLVIGDNLGGANTAIVVAKIYSQIADTSNMTIHADGQYDMGGEGDTIRSLVIDRGTVVGVPTNGFGSLELNGSLTMTGGSISGGTGANFGVELQGGAGVSDVTATSDATGNAATINSNLTLSLSNAPGLMRTFTVNAGPGAVDLVINGVIQNGASLNSIVKAGTGTMELTRSNTYTGGTAITGGTLLANNLSGSATGTGPVKVSGGTLGGSGSVGGNVTLGAGGVIAPGAAATGISTATLTLGSNLSWDGGGTVNLELGAGAATSDLLAVTGNMAKGAPGTLGINTFGINIADAGGFGAQPAYTLITFAGTTFAAATDFTLESLPAGYSGALVLGANDLTLQVQTVGQAFWKGGVDTVWTTNTGGNTNWATDLGGLTGSGVPGATTDVTFSATGSANQNTTLGADLTIKSLRVIDPAAVTTGGPNKLTIDNTAAQAITVFSGAGLLTISADVALAGAASTITVNNAAGAAISGSITGANGLIKDGIGTLKLTGDNNYTGLTIVRDGPLQLQGPTTNTMIRGTVVVGDGVGAANSAVLELQAGSQIADTVGVTVNSDGKFIAGGEGIGALTVNGGTVDTGPATGLDVVSLDMTGGSVVGAKRLGLNGDVTTHAADTAATISAAVVTTYGVTQTFTVADGPAATDLLVSSLILSSGGSTAVTKAGPGTLELTSGASSYSSGTTVNGGTLLANNASGSATSSGAVVVNPGATLGGNGTVTGPVTLNTAAFIAPGAVTTGISTAKLTAGALTWNGGGTLQLQLGASIGTSDLLAVTGALTKGTAGAYGVNVTDAGGFGTLQTYTLVSFASTDFAVGDFTLSPLPPGYTGTLVLDADSLDLTLTGFTASGPIIQNSSPVSLPTFADYIVTGATMTGNPQEDNTIHTLTFQPGGSLTIFNTLFVTTGPVDVPDGGSILLGSPAGAIGNLSVSQLNLFPGSMLSGNGSIIGHLFNNGVVSPGFSPGKISVTGNYTQGSSGTLRIEIGGRLSGEHDALAVGGAAALGGTLQLVRLNNFSLKRGDKVTFLTAGQGVSGEFAQVSNPFVSDTILEPTVVYHEDSVALEMVQGSFEELASRLGLTPNQRAVAEALDRLSPHDPDHQALVYLDDRKLEKLPGDLDLIAPDELTSIFTISTSLATVQSINLQRRTDDIRHGSSGFSANGLAIQGTGPGYSGPIGLSTGQTGVAGDSKEMKQVQEQAVSPAEQKWGAFLTGVGEWVDVGGDGNGSSYDFTTGGFTLGLDYKVSPHFAIGLAAGYAGTSADLTEGGRTWVNSGKLGIYATVFTGGWYADFAVTGGYNSYDTKRASLEGSARGSTSGGEFNAIAVTGYDWKIGALQIGPTATFQYTLVGINGFTEHGSLAPLDIAGQDVESTRSAFGFKASWDWKVGSALIRPELRAAWQHEYGDTAYALRSSFATGGGGSFVVHGPETGRDALLLGAGVAIRCSERCTAYLYYDGVLGRTNYEQHSVSGGVRVSF